MSIKLSVATNFDADLPRELARFNREVPHARVTRAYGSLPADVVGSGRPARWLPQIGLPELQAQVEMLAAEGIEFAYTLNAPDLFGSEEDPEWRSRLDGLLSDLWEARVRRLVVSNRWLLKHLRDHYEFACTLSLIHGVNSPERAARAEARGVDEICLTFLGVNRDLDLITRIRAATHLDLELLANSASFPDCSVAHQHYRLVGSRSRRDKLDEAEGRVPADPFILQCSLRLVADPALFALTAFVPPGYLGRYAAAGIDRFKLTDRCSETPSLLGTLRAYGPDHPLEDLYPSVLKGGSRLREGLRGLFPADFVRELRLPQLRIDGRRFVDEGFIERGLSMSDGEKRALAASLVTVLDPEYLARFLAFYTAVVEKVAGRTLVPAAEIPEFLALRRLLSPEAVGVGSTGGRP